MLKLVDVYSEPRAALLLWQLLCEREPQMNISHKVMPTWEQHCDFVRSRPYQAWYLIEEIVDGFVGAVYLTHNSEIGIFMLKSAKGKGYGKVALKELMWKHRSSRYLANIAPSNDGSISFFEKQGFRHIQNTYELVM